MPLDRGNRDILALFDIDGTLVRRAGPHHRDALADAVRQVTGLETSTNGIPVHGMLDRDILRAMLERAGASPDGIADAMPNIAKVAQALYAKSCPDLRHAQCPHARRLLARFDRLKVPMGLVTGNLSRIARKKLHCAGLGHYFRFGAFAEEADTRAGLVRLARERARRKRWIDEDTQVSLIGDSPNDVIAARQAGVRSIAVCTGISSRQELADERPDILIEDLGALRIAMLR